MKTLVRTQLRLEAGPCREYVGRFLGFITSDEYRKIIGNPELTSRISMLPTKSLCACCSTANEKNWGLGGARFVLLVKRINGVPQTRRLLLVSDALNFVSEIRPDDREVTISTMSGASIVLREENE